MEIRLKTDAADVAKAIKSVGQRQLNFALSNTINDLAFQGKKDHVPYVNKVFDRPTKWTENALEVLKASRNPGGPRWLRAYVQFKATAFKGTPPTKYLKAQAMGGTRADKRSEVALRAKGILPPGYQTIVMPKYQDRYGNIRGSLMVKILSYVRAFGEVGYNMNRSYTKAQKTSLDKMLAKQQQNPDKYFVMTSRKSKKPIGIFERKGNGPAGRGKIEPILMFVPTPKYTKRYDLPSLVVKTVRQNWRQRWSINYARAALSMKYTKSGKANLLK